MRAGSPALILCVGGTNGRNSKWRHIMARGLTISTLLLVLGLALAATASWPASADSNLLICGRTGEQTVPKVAVTSDGGCYVCWMDHASGNYDLYLQRLNAQGVPQWVSGGLLISNHPQDTWITDYDMTVDSADYAVIAINDIRSGDDWDIYAYRVSPMGQSVWGPNGLTISDNDGFEPEPRVIVTRSGNIVFAWTEGTATSTVVNVRKVTPAGADMWTPAQRTLTGPNGLSIPRIAAAGNDAVIVQYLWHTGPDFWSPRYIRAQKYDSLGGAMWSDTGVVISNAGGIGVQMKPNIMPDGAGGAYSYWYDTRTNNIHHVYVQRVSSNGAMAWTVNGVQVAVTASQMEMDPSLIRLPGTGTVAVFYMITDLPQSNWGVGGQRLDANGAPLWGAGGVAFVPLGLQQRYGVSAFYQGENAAALYLEFAEGSQTNTRLKALGVNLAGQPVWTPSPVVMCNVLSGKGHLAAAVNPFGQVLAAWHDDRADLSGDIYLQNVNPDGSLGDIGQLRPSIRILMPSDGDTTSFLPFFMMILVEHFEVAEAPDGDGEVEVRVNGNLAGWVTDPITAQVEQLAAGWNMVVLELVDHNHTPLPVHAMDSIHVFYRSSAAKPLPGGMAREFALLAPHPNPFNPSTTVRFSLPRESAVRLTLYDVLGRQVRELAVGMYGAGLHEFVLDASGLPGGLYFCRLDAGGFQAVQKLILMK